MKIIIISDIHGSAYFLRKVLKVVENEKIDYILILGDVLNHGPRNPLPEGYNPKEVVDILNSYKNRIIAVRGNCDSEVDQMLLEYPMMSDYTTLFLNEKRIFVTHGHIYNRDNLPQIEKGDVLLYGHTHIPLAENENDIYILNPGSISLPKNGNENSYGILEDNNFYVKNLESEIIKKIELK